MVLHGACAAHWTGLEQSDCQSLHWSHNEHCVGKYLEASPCGLLLQHPLTIEKNKEKNGLWANNRAICPNIFHMSVPLQKTWINQALGVAFEILWQALFPSPYSILFGEISPFFNLKPGKVPFLVYASPKIVQQSGLRVLLKQWHKTKRSWRNIHNCKLRLSVQQKVSALSISLRLENSSLWTRFLHRFDKDNR